MRAFRVAEPRLYFPVQAKAALFLLASSFFGGFFVATKINQYMFEKSKGKGGGGQRAGFGAKGGIKKAPLMKKK